jgi:hypothetical protein
LATLPVEYLKEALPVEHEFYGRPEEPSERGVVVDRGERVLTMQVEEAARVKLHREESALLAKLVADAGHLSEFTDGRKQ